MQANVPGGCAAERDRQGLLVREAEERRPIVLVRLPERLAVVGEEDDDPRVAAGHGNGIATVVENDAVERRGVAQVHLPPRLGLVLRVEAPLTVLDAIAAAGGVLLRRDRPLLAGRSGGAADSQLAQPVGLDLRGGDDRVLRLGGLLRTKNAGRHGRVKQARGKRGDENAGCSLHGDGP